MTTSTVGNTPPPPISVEAFMSQSAGSAWLGSNGDLASFVMAEQVKYQDDLISDRLTNVDLQSQTRELYSARIADLRQCLADYKKANEGTTSKTYQMSVPHGGAKMDASIDRATRSVEVTWGDPIGTPIRSTGNEYPDYHVRSTVDIDVTGDALAQEIKRLEDVCQQLDSNREIEMIQLNSLIGKRANTVQLLSNISKKKNDTEGAIINNMR